MAKNTHSSTPDGLTQALRWSAGVHVAVFVLVAVFSWVFPGTPSRYIPTLRVDLVGLPDVLKKDLKEDKATGSAEEENTEPAKKSPQEKLEKADPDEMVTQSKSAKNEQSKKNRRSLERLKALAKIEEDDDHPRKPIKGNMLSKGASLSADARESGEPAYLDLIRDRLQDRFELNPLLARQKLSARVRIWIDSGGKLRKFIFEQTSGNTAFDAAVKRAVESSSPFPRPPRDVISSILLDGVLVGFPL